MRIATVILSIVLGLLVLGMLLAYYRMQEVEEKAGVFVTVTPGDAELLVEIRGARRTIPVSVRDGGALVKVDVGRSFQISAEAEGHEGRTSPLRRIESPDAPPDTIHLELSPSDRPGGVPPQPSQPPEEKPALSTDMPETVQDREVAAGGEEHADRRKKESVASSLTVISTVDGARILVNGDELGKTRAGRDGSRTMPVKSGKELRVELRSSQYADSVYESFALTPAEPTRTLKYHPPPLTYSLVLTAPRMQLQSGQRAEVFIDGSSTPAGSRASGTLDKIPIKDVPPEAKNGTFKFTSGEYSEEWEFDVRFPDGTNVASVDLERDAGDAFNLLRVTSNVPEAPVEYKGGLLPEYVRVGVTDLALPVKWTYANLRVRDFSNQEKERTVPTSGGAAAFIFPLPDAAELMKKGDSYWNQGNMAPNPEQQMAEYDNAIVAYQQAVEYDRDYDPYRVTLLNAEVRRLETWAQYGNSSEQQLDESMRDLLQRIGVLLEQNPDPQSAGRLHTANARLNIVDGRGGREQAVLSFQEAFAEYERAIEVYEELHLVGDVRKEYDRCLAELALAKGELYDITGDDLWRDQACDAWNAYDFPPVKVPGHVSKGLSNPWTDKRKREMQRLGCE